MFARLILSGVLVCSFVFADVATGVAAPGKRSGGVLKGKTAQGYRIKVSLLGSGKLKLIGFKADLDCRDGTVLQLDEGGFLPSAVRRNGAFRETQYGSTDTVRIRGKLKGRRVSGTLRLTDRYGKGNPCKSRWIKFNAH